MFKYEAKENVVRDSQGMSIGWMNAYVYTADLYCEDCGEALKEGKEDTGDSGDYPQGPYPDGGGESDSPQHCGGGEGCLNAMTFVGRKVGVWLGNPLTTDGVEYMKEMLSNPNATPYQMALHEFWSDVYADYLDYLELGEAKRSRAHTPHVFRPGEHVFIAFADGVDEGEIIERGQGNWNLRTRPHDPYIVAITVGQDAGGQYPISSANLFSDSTAASIRSAELHREAMKESSTVRENRTVREVKSLPYGDKSPEQVYAEAAALLKEWAAPDAGGGVLESSKWIRPSQSEMFANGKPIVVTKMGRKYTVTVMGNPVTRDAEGKLTFVGRPGAVPGPAAEFKSKDEADSVAHRIGHYMLGLGDFVDTYVEHRSASGAREPNGMREQPEPDFDPDYIIQGLYSDSRIESEFGYNDEDVALSEAKKLLRAPWFEGDYVRVITRDGELVWDSRGGEPSGYGTWLLPPELNESRVLENRHTVREVNFQQGERLKIRSKGSQGQPFESFWYTVDTQAMSLTDVALQFAQTGQPGMIIEIVSPTNSAGTQPRLKWTFQVGRHGGQTTVTRVKETHGVREKGVLEDRATNTAIRIWMKANANEFTDPRTGELNTTALVEAWDIENAGGAATLDPNHPAWDIATEFAGYQSVHERHHTVRETNFQQGERLRIRIKGPQGQPFESFWYTVDNTMSLTDVALQFAQTTGEPGMFIEIVSGKLKWTFQRGRYAGQPSVERVKSAPVVREKGVLEASARLTDNEMKVMLAIANSEYQDAVTTDHLIGHQVYSTYIADDVPSISRKSISGVFSSLAKKGLITTNYTTIERRKMDLVALTAAGAAALPADWKKR